VSCGIDHEYDELSFCLALLHKSGEGFIS